jgi:hypothetical protein
VLTARAERDKLVAVMWPNGKAYFFRGDQYVRYEPNPSHEGVEPGYPKPIEGNWPGLGERLREGLDATAVWPNGNAYFFAGNGYLRYTIDPAREGINQEFQYISLNWKGLWPDGIDAVLVWPDNEIAYFFKGAEYVRYNMDPRQEGVEPGYPKCISGNWPGLAEAFPEGIDTAIVWSSTTGISSRVTTTSATT